jgi:hypothetical protein
MMSLSDQRPFTLALMAFAGLGLLTLAGNLAPSWARLGGNGTVAISSPWLIYPETVRQGSFNDFTAIAEEPLFNSDRKKDPPPPPLPSAQSQIPALDSYRLVGVIVTADKSLALVERRATKAVIELKLGDNLDGRVVKDITALGIVFGGSGAGETLSIPKAAGARLAPALDQKSQDQNKMGNGVARRGAGVGDLN